MINSLRAKDIVVVYKIDRIVGKSYDWITKELHISKKTIADIKKSLPSLNLQLPLEKSELYA